MGSSPEPYYRSIKNAEELLDHYLSLYETIYMRKKVAAYKKRIPQELWDQRVLDMGCGGGFYSALAATKGPEEIVEVDLEKTCVKATQLKVGRSSKTVTYGAVANSFTLPFQSETFNLILCIDVIEHIKEDETAIRELYRVLKPNGLLIISSQNSLSANYAIQATYERKVRRRRWMVWDPTHVRVYNPKSFFNLLRGFNVMEIAGTYFIPYSLCPLRFLRESAMMLNEFCEKHCTRTPFKFLGGGIASLCCKTKPTRA